MARTASKTTPGKRTEAGARAAAVGAVAEPRKRRSAAPEARRAAILDAALEEFTARGYEGARLDDVAKRAGVAKGTIYLYFADKEALFQELIRAKLSPVVGELIQVSHTDIPIRQFVHHLVDVFAREVFETRRKDVIRLVLTEGPRFPHIAEFYYREVVERIMTVIRALAQRAVARGELPNDALVRFPQLMGAPGIVAIIWSGLFDRWAKIDVEAFMLAYLDLVFARRAA